MADISLNGKQGRGVNIDSTGSRITFGREVKSFLLLLPPSNTNNLYFHVGKSGLAAEADKTASVLKAAYPYLIGEETLEFEAPGDGVVDTLDLCCSTGQSINDIRIVLL